MLHFLGGCCTKTPENVTLFVRMLHFFRRMLHFSGWCCTFSENVALFSRMLHFVAPFLKILHFVTLSQGCCTLLHFSRTALCGVTKCNIFKKSATKCNILEKVQQLFEINFIKPRGKSATFWKKCNRSATWISRILWHSNFRLVRSYLPISHPCQE